ncbi:MAG: hypothetical protein E7481_04865 [Ruminococcaceae bacterium]|nr:hypothetical protein [Oscillospiraceae bacterium]
MSTQLQNRIIKILEDNGIYVSDDWDEELEFDSITFISTIVCFEDEFNIEIPDDFLLFENFKTFRLYVENIAKLLSEIDVEG